VKKTGGSSKTVANTVGHMAGTPGGVHKLSEESEENDGKLGDHNNF